MPELHDIVLPEAVPYWPGTPVWYVVFAILLALGAGAAVALGRHRRRNRYRKLALERLADIEARGALKELPALVKQTALFFAPRAEVASLTGDAWLQFLDDSVGGRGFTEGAGRSLLELSYGRAAAADVSGLVDLLRHWIRKHQRHVRA